MPGHAFWKGFLRISLVSIPVKAYTATRSGERITLNQLHAPCHSRIQYRKTCPIHGEVPADQIVSGYEFERGKYVEIDTDELETLRTEKDRNINVDTFVTEGAIDPAYYSGKTYYVLPEAASGQKPYQIVVQAMRDQGVEAVAQGVLSRREQLVVLRAVDDLLVMTTLIYAAEMKAADEFQSDLTTGDVNKKELQLAKQLIGAMTTKKLDLTNYRDVYNDKLTQLIEAKVQGKELVHPDEPPAPRVINLMDAMKASMKNVKPPTAKAKSTAPARKKSASPLRQVVAARRKSATRKRKSG